MRLIKDYAVCVWQIIGCKAHIWVYIKNKYEQSFDTSLLRKEVETLGQGNAIAMVNYQRQRFLSNEIDAS